MNLSIIAFHKHVEMANFQINLDKGWWGVPDSNPERPSWPYIYIWVKAAKKQNGPDKFYFRFDLTNYPKDAPTACPWDMENNFQLAAEKWPKGQKFVSSVFKPSNNYLYAPCDRLADLIGHAQWANEHPDYFWKSGSSTITTYLNFLKDLLNSTDYATSN